MNLLKQALKSTPVVYVTRDIERAIGLPVDTEGYFIISNASEFAKALSFGMDNILLINESKNLDTRELLQRDETRDFLKNIANPNILVFKNTKQIEKICADKGWKLLNPPSSISDIVEPKMSQIVWLEDLAKYLPTYTVLTCEEIEWKGKPFVLQFNHSHTGSGTMMVDSIECLKEIKDKYPKREARIADYINGPLYTNNNCVHEDKISIGNISYQITGLSPFTDREFATIGNDWSLPKNLMTESQKAKYIEIVTMVGDKLRKDGWVGLFGIDTIVDSSTDELYLLEINCRQPASTSFEAKLQKTHHYYGQTRNKKQETNLASIYEMHLGALLEIDMRAIELIDDIHGAQIIYRNKENKSLSFNLQTVIAKLLTEGFDIVQYQNTKSGSDLLRIQSTVGIMKNQNEFNENGKKILSILS